MFLCGVRELPSEACWRCGVSPFWRGVFSVFFFGNQPCWFFGHDWVADFDDYWKSHPECDLFERLNRQFQMTILYSWPARKCLQCKRKEPTPWPTETKGFEFTGVDRDAQ